MKMAFCQRPARTGFKIFLECGSRLSLLESDVHFELPRDKLGGVWRIAAVMVEKALFEIGCASDILLRRMGFRSEEVYVKHRHSALRTTHAPWLACQLTLGGRRAGPPSPRLRRTLQPSLGALLQAKAGAGDEARTRDVLLGKEVLYH